MLTSVLNYGIIKYKLKERSICYFRGIAAKGGAAPNNCAKNEEKRQIRLVRMTRWRMIEIIGGCPPVLPQDAAAAKLRSNPQDKSDCLGQIFIME